MHGKYYPFMAVTHAITVILFLIWIPFGKFFHIIQRPAQLGIAIYRKAGARGRRLSVRIPARSSRRRCRSMISRW